jgi:hypothetical protein
VPTAEFVSAALPALPALLAFWPAGEGLELLLLLPLLLAGA